MKIKNPATLVTFPRNGEILVYNYLTKQAVTCAPEDIYWLTLAEDWISIEEIAQRHSQFDAQSIRDQLLQLVSAGILIADDTPEAAEEAKYRKFWELGPAVGVFHFSMLDNDFADTDESVRRQRERTLHDPSPELMWKNSLAAIALPRQSSAETRPLFEIMKRRRSNRNSLDNPVTQQELADCLFAGLGITGYTKTETAILPLKMTPSGGARNPFEAFVWARNIEGLTPGIYHYSAQDHSIEKIDSAVTATPAEMMKGQDWANDMPAIIFLVAVLRRTTWKYNDPNAYRVVMIEAGHIAQNMMLASTGNKLTACPTAAIAHTPVAAMLGLDDITETPVYALMLGKPSPVSDKLMTDQWGTPLVPELTPPELQPDMQAA